MRKQLLISRGAIVVVVVVSTVVAGAAGAIASFNDTPEPDRTMGFPPEVGVVKPVTGDFAGYVDRDYITLVKERPLVEDVATGEKVPAAPVYAEDGEFTGYLLDGYGFLESEEEGTFDSRQMRGADGAPASRTSPTSLSEASEDPQMPTPEETRELVESYEAERGD